MSVDPNGAPPGWFYDATTETYKKDPPGTYSTGGATIPTWDPGGTYSMAGASAPITDPAGTYSSGSLNRLFLMWENNVPANVALAFTSLLDVENYFGGDSYEARVAQQFFAINNGKIGATIYFQREGIGQRPHLIGANVTQYSLAQLQAIHGNISVVFDGFTYNGWLNLQHVTDDGGAAQAIYRALNRNLPIAATTVGNVITPVTVNFTGFFNKAQLTVTSVQSGALVVGGLVNGAGVEKHNKVDTQIIYDHSGNGGPGHYSTFNKIGVELKPEAMTETYGILTVGAVTSGNLAIGDQVTGPGVPPLTALLENFGGGTGAGSTWLVNNAANISGNFTITAPVLTVKNNYEQGATETHDNFEIQPNGAFGFDSNPSALSFASSAGKGDDVATLLGLTQASGAIDSSPGGQHPTLAQFLNNIVENGLDQNGNPVTFGSIQTNDPRFEGGLALWALTKEGLGHELLPDGKFTPPAGQNHPITDPPGTFSGPGASKPTKNPPSFAEANDLLSGPIAGYSHYDAPQSMSAYNVMVGALQGRGE